MNLTIALCDDDPHIHKLFEQFQLHFNMECDDTLLIEHFYSGEAILTSYMTNHRYDALIMDVEMPHRDGIDISSTIRQKYDRHVPIVFLTSYPQYMKNSFQVHAFDYLMKPITYDSFKKLIGSLLEDLCASSLTMTLLTVQHEEYLIRIDELMYIESQTIPLQDTKLLFHMKNGNTHVTKGKLTEWEAKLADQYFVSPYRGILVNMKYIYRFQGNDIELLDETRIPLSRKKAPYIKAQFARAAFTLSYKR